MSRVINKISHNVAGTVRRIYSSWVCLLAFNYRATEDTLTRNVSVSRSLSISMLTFFFPQTVCVCVT